MRLLPWYWVALFSCVPLLAVRAQSGRVATPTSRRELLSGRVTTDSGRAVAAATIIVTRAPDRAVFQLASDSSGGWRLSVPEGTGDYLVYVSAPGFSALRRRVARDLPLQAGVSATDSGFTIAMTLRRVVPQTLATVDVVAKKPRAMRPTLDMMNLGVGASETNVEGVTGRVSPELEGNLAALAATMPGITAVDGGFSALGLGASQSAITISGLQFSGQDIPRDLRTLTRVATSTYDPSRGWFGGAQVTLEVSPGLQYAYSNAHLTLDAPTLQTRNPLGGRGASQLTNLQGSFAREAGTMQDRLTYSLGVQGSRRAQDALSIYDADADALRRSGVSPDTAQRLRTILGAVGVPIGVPSFGSSWGALTEDRLSFAGRIGTPIVDYLKNVEPNTIVGVSAFGSWRRTQGVGLTPTAVGTRSGEASAMTLGAIAQFSKFIEPEGWLLELKSGLSGTSDTQTPYSLLPTGRVLAGGDAIDGYPSGLNTLAFGGNGQLDSHRRTALWESQGSLNFFVPGQNRHEFRVAADVRLDAVHIQQSADRFGTYRFESLTDLAAGRASSFSRTLRTPAVSAAGWNAFASLGDEWRVRPGLRLLYGVRLEGNRFVNAPDRTDALVRALGVETDRVPNRVAVSPRLGFTWRRSVREDNYTMGSMGAFRIPRRSMIRGGIGQFRNLLTPDLVAYARSNTGLIDGTAQLLCTGDAVPEPQWASWVTGGTLPTTCAAGAPSMFVDAAPRVSTLDPRVNAPRSWRANLALSGTRWNASYTLEGIVSWNLDQFGTRDANFSGIPRFTLADEGRPVFVSPSSVVSVSGAVSPVESRIRSEFSRVLVQHSQLRSLTRQVSLTLSPSAFHSHWWTSGTYVLGFMRQRAAGFDGATFGDPRASLWSPGDADVRHQLIVQSGLTFNGIALTLFGRLASGAPFTPLVGSDVNGDGSANDAAFIYDVNASGTPTPLGNELRSLLASAQSHTRRCIEQSVGRAAGRNTCNGPWTSSLNARIGIDGTRVGLGARTKIGINLANPLGGLDQLLHGDALRGWGTPAFPDRVLLQVRGFDATRRAFTYAVNPRFGDTRPRAGSVYVPFRATVDVSIDLAPTMALQQMQKWLGPGRRGKGTRFTEKEYLDRFLRGSPDPYRTIVQQSDTLLLNREQIAALQRAQTQFRAKIQAMWQPLAAELAAEDAEYDARRFERRQHVIADSVWNYTGDDLRAVLPTILSAIQLQLLPSSPAAYYRQTDNRRPSYFFF